MIDAHRMFCSMLRYNIYMFQVFSFAGVEIRNSDLDKHKQTNRPGPCLSVLACFMINYYVQMGCRQNETRGQSSFECVVLFSKYDFRKIVPLAAW